MKTIEEKTETVLHALGITRKYLGYDIMISAVSHIDESPGRIRCVSKELFPLIIEETGYTMNSIERNVRTCSQAAFKKERKTLETMAGCKLYRPPTTVAFLEIVHRTTGKVTA